MGTEKNNTMYTFNGDGSTFTSREAARFKKIYFPLCGTDANSIKSSITPFLSGDIKIDKDRYITKPASTEDLRYPIRNFFLYTESDVYSLFDERPEEQCTVTAGQLWHKTTKIFKNNCSVESLNFIPVTGEQVEIMKVTVTNQSEDVVNITPTAVIPIFGRALANKHDHEHVTSLLHRIEQSDNGVVVKPVMLFNEEEHKDLDTAYFVLGCDQDQNYPQGSFPTIEDFCGTSGSLQNPEAVLLNREPSQLDSTSLQGKEAVGALRFASIDLKPQESRQYIILIGTADDQNQADQIFKKFASTKAVEEALEENKKYWDAKVSAIDFQSSDATFNSWMQWVTLQPVLRRIYGCSFLPDHDYGKGGKGWRDIWQDLLSLILIEPENIREMLINNFSGVRIDGSNATIIGSHLGEFIADRNHITRVWMDHGAWPFLTLLLYIHQTGDFDILFEKCTYYRDGHLSRTKKFNSSLSGNGENKLKTKDGKIYEGTILEHLIIQNLVQFYNVGKHNITRLENADWNDGFDMAFENGESTTFMALYGGNLTRLADLLDAAIEHCDVKEVKLAEELDHLLDTVTGNNINYEDVNQKIHRLTEGYFSTVEPDVSGKQKIYSTESIVNDLRLKGNWIYEHIREQEWITVKDGGDEFSWFNGYYDNQSNRVEGKVNDQIRMTLTGQVFPIMSGLAEDKEISAVSKSVNKYLKDKDLGGIRLNSDFGLKNYLDLGRAFGFAFGTKENGSFFSHMAVMYAYALYSRGFVVEGRKVLQSIYRMCLDTEKSRIYPGIPEYMDSNGVGMYHYLTGSASWLVLTELTEVFGIKGSYGDLVIEPKLTLSEFDDEGKAKVSCHFAGKQLNVCYNNTSKNEFGKYSVDNVAVNGADCEFDAIEPSKVLIARSQLTESSENSLNIDIVLA